MAPHEILLLVRNLNDYQGLGRYMEEYGLLSTLADVTDLAGQPLPLFLTKLWEAALTKDDTMPLLALMKTTLMQELFHVDRIAVGHLVEESYIETPGFLLERISHLSGVSDLKPLLKRSRRQRPVRSGGIILTKGSRNGTLCGPLAGSIRREK